MDVPTLPTHAHPWMSNKSPGEKIVFQNKKKTVDWKRKDNEIKPRPIKKNKKKKKNEARNTDSCTKTRSRTGTLQTNNGGSKYE